MSIEIGMIIIGLLSIFPAIYFHGYKSKLWLYVYLFISPAIYGYLFYWVPNLKNINNEEYRTWSYMFVTLFAIGSFIGTFIGFALDIIFKLNSKSNQPAD